ncbi:inhibitor of apoptosis-promoting Bax1-domain-containing protein [Paraphysoderma sedebokerense]|nr:inhibitor of apoptosis-promoting Bax1-domain-containing protein [Paraphysoderma sedebokerense]
MKHSEEKPPQYTAFPPPENHSATSTQTAVHPDAHVIPVLGYSAYAPEQANDAPPLYTKLDEMSVDVRMRFIRRVYAILGAQLALTTGITALFYFENTLHQWVLSNYWIVFTSWIVGLVCIIALSFLRKKKPLNWLLLFLFTLCFSVAVAVTVSFYDSRTVFQAVIITFAIFVILQLYTIQSRVDFSGAWPFLYAATWALIFTAIIQAFLPYSSFIQALIAFVGAVVFSFWIIFDTYRIFRRLAPDEEITAATSLYIDVVLLFLSILGIANGLGD